MTQEMKTWEYYEKVFWESIRRGITKRLRELCMMNDMREVFRIVFRICCIFRLRL